MLEKASPIYPGKLPSDSDTTSVKNLTRTIREIFESNPLIAEKMLEELEHSEPVLANVKTHNLLRSLIRMYQGCK